MDFTLATWYPMLLFLVAAVGFAAGAMVATHIIGPHKRTAVKEMPYESGMDPIGDARQRFDVKFYLIAILFLVFDVELLFLVSPGRRPTRRVRTASAQRFRPASSSSKSFSFWRPWSSATYTPGGGECSDGDDGPE